MPFGDVYDGHVRGGVGSRFADAIGQDNEEKFSHQGHSHACRGMNASWLCEKVFFVLLSVPPLGKKILDFLFW